MVLRKAVVIGGSVAGLLTAYVLSKHFQEIIIVEKDNFADDAYDKISCNNLPSGDIIAINCKLYLE